MDHPIYSCLWFDGQAHEAAEYYCSIFKNSKIHSSNPMVVMFELNDTLFMGLNGGPHFTFNESVSFVVNCDTQNEIDYYWNQLTQGGQESRCGWLKDRYGVSWQIIPSDLGQLMNDPSRAARVGEALLKMNKLDIQVLRNA